MHRDECQIVLLKPSGHARVCLRESQLVHLLCCLQCAKPLYCCHKLLQRKAAISICVYQVEYARYHRVSCQLWKLLDVLNAGFAITTRDTDKLALQESQLLFSEVLGLQLAVLLPHGPLATL
eukprot:GHUV01049807.1.p2 GENE.GHUV01049807.1~~GHUV01049807.1.p2  ORF type:complete len:122 (-),score=10.95 GHUV01049807.1:340-705(-)